MTIIQELVAGNSVVPSDLRPRSSDTWLRLSGSSYIVCWLLVQIATSIPICALTL